MSKPKIVNDMLDSMKEGTVLKSTVTMVGGDGATIYTISMRPITPRERDELERKSYR